jgi:hypothetical protein
MVSMIWLLRSAGHHSSQSNSQDKQLQPTTQSCAVDVALMLSLLS